MGSHIIGHIRLNKLTNELIQSEINQEAARHSPKYIRNIYALLTASLEMFAPNFHYHFSYPDNRKKDIRIPSAGDICRLLAVSPSADHSLTVKFAAFLGLRRGEICGIYVEDVNLDENKTVCKTICGAFSEKKWVKKFPRPEQAEDILSFPL